MAIVSREELRVLVADAEPPCVSILLPTHRLFTESEQDILLLRGLIKEARRQLTDAGLRGADANKLLAPVEELIDDRPFWQHQRDSLVIFSSKNMFRYYRLPQPLKESLVIGNRFHVKPLMSLLTDGQFYLLALSQKEVRLFKCTRFTIDEIELEDVPKSVAQLIGYHELETRAQFKSAGPGGAKGRWAGVFFGMGFGAEHTKDDILKFFQRIDRAVSRLLREEQMPLVLACVDYLLPIYKEANTYPGLMNEAITGSPQEHSVKQLHELAWAKIEPQFQRDRHEAARLYTDAKAKGLASSELAQVVPAAYYGRVHTLFVALDQPRWGTFNPDTSEVKVQSEAKPGYEDLLNFSAIHTLLNGGAVYIVEPEKVPDSAPLAALFRY